MEDGVCSWLREQSSVGYLASKPERQLWKSPASSSPPPSQRRAQTRVGHTLLIKINEIWAPTRTCHYPVSRLHQLSSLCFEELQVEGVRVRARARVIVFLHEREVCE